MLALFFVLAALATPLPLPVAPSPTPPPEILHVVVTPVCTMLRETIAPVSAIERSNDRSFTDFSGQAARLNEDIFKNYDLGQDVELEMTTIAHRGQYGVGVVSTSIEHAQQLLDASRKHHPDAQYPDLVPLRTQIEAVLASQRLYNSLLDAVTGAYLDAQGVSAVAQQTPQLNYVNGIRAILGAPAIPRLPQPGDTEQTLAQFRSDLHTGISVNPSDPNDLTDPSNVRKQMLTQEAQAWNTTVATINTCKKHEGSAP